MEGTPPFSPRAGRVGGPGALQSRLRGQGDDRVKLWVELLDASEQVCRQLDRRNVPAADRTSGSQRRCEVKLGGGHG